MIRNFLGALLTTSSAALLTSDLPEVKVSDFVERTFENVTDHFNYLDNRTFN